MDGDKMNTKGRRKVGILAQGAVCHYCALSTMKMFSVTAQHDNTEGDLASVWHSLSLSISSSFWSDDSEWRNVYLIMLQSCYYSRCNWNVAWLDTSHQNIWSGAEHGYQVLLLTLQTAGRQKISIKATLIIMFAVKGNVLGELNISVGAL